MLHNAASNADIDSFRLDIFPYEISVDTQPGGELVHLRILPAAQYVDLRSEGKYPSHFTPADKRAMQDPLTFIGDVDLHMANVLIRAVTTQVSKLPINAIKA